MKLYEAVSTSAENVDTGSSATCFTGLTSKCSNLSRPSARNGGGAGSSAAASLRRNSPPSELPVRAGGAVLLWPDLVRAGRGVPVTTSSSSDPRDSCSLGEERFASCSAWMGSTITGEGVAGSASAVPASTPLRSSAGTIGSGALL